jgi:hypothetical protein
MELQDFIKNLWLILPPKHSCDNTLGEGERGKETEVGRGEVVGEEEKAIGEVGKHGTLRR